ncbi:hypothetical protein HK101_011508 [Irineochytrium annulatum]|nr:hypothetical protein HK101_011508 [Irineochytrium annulatum]
MAQGAVKKNKGAAAKNKKDKPTGPKRGGTTIAPKKANLTKQLALKKKLTAGTINETERQMAARAGTTGKLTIMKKTAEGAIKELAGQKKKGKHVLPAAAAGKIKKKK